jgi:hypothetical protein
MSPFWRLEFLSGVYIFGKFVNALTETTRKKTHCTTSSWQAKEIKIALTEVLLLIHEDLHIAYKNTEEIIQHSQVRA